MFSNLINNDTINKYPLGELKNVNLGEYNDSIGMLMDDKFLRCRKVIIKPNEHQLPIIKGWFKSYQLAYNEILKVVNALRYFNQKIPSFYSLREAYKKDVLEKIKAKLGEVNTPSHTIDNAINDVVKAYKSGIANVKAGHYRDFRMRYKKGSRITLVLEASAFSKKYNSFCPKILGNHVETSEEIKGITHDCRFQWSPGKPNQFILFKPIEVEQRNFDRKPICSLDPGVRTFQTGYDRENFFEIGTNLSKKIKPIADKIEAKFSEKKKGWYKRLQTRLYDKIRHIVDDCHFKSAKWLCQNYDTIIIGKISTVSIASGSNLIGNQKRLLYLLSHYNFRQRLLAKAEITDCKVIIADESYTSKTCGGCGKLNFNLGSSKVFQCNCGFLLDRDFNGARNIMIKNLG